MSGTLNSPEEATNSGVGTNTKAQRKRRKKEKQKMRRAEAKKNETEEAELVALMSTVALEERWFAGSGPAAPRYPEEEHTSSTQSRMSDGVTDKKDTNGFGTDHLSGKDMVQSSRCVLR